MNAQELLVEVQKTSGYAEGRPNYDAILSQIRTQRPELSRIVQLFEPRMNNPFDSIDEAIEFATETVQRSSPATQPHKQRTASLFFKSTYEMMLNGLDRYIETQGQLRDSSSGFARDLKAKQYDTRNPEMGAVSRERDDIVRTHETRAQRRTEISEEVAENYEKKVLPPTSLKDFLKMR